MRWPIACRTVAAAARRWSSGGGNWRQARFTSGASPLGGGVAALIPAALQTGVAVLADRGGSAEELPPPVEDAAAAPVEVTSMPTESDMVWPGTQPDGAMPPMAPADASGSGVINGRSAVTTPADSRAPVVRAAMAGRSALPAAVTPVSMPPGAPSGSSTSFALPLLLGGAAVAIVLLLRASAAPPTRRHR